MAIGKVTSVKKITPANKIRTREEEVKFTERPSTQQKSVIQLELEKEEALIREITNTVHREENLYQTKQLNRIATTNKNFKAVLQIHRIAIEVINGKSREIFVPQSKLIFDNDDDYYAWAMKGGMDKDLNPEHDYVALRKIISNK